MKRPPHDKRPTHDEESIHQVSRAESDTDERLRSVEHTMPLTAEDVAALDRDDDLDGFCPKCSAELRDPIRVGWCLRCGYCRYLENVKTIEPLKIPLDPETRRNIELILELSRVLRKKGGNRRRVQDHCELLEGLARLIKKKARLGQDVSSYRDLLQLLSKKFVKGQTDVNIDDFDELFESMSRRYKAEMDASHAGGKYTVNRLNVPIPLLDLVPEWLAVLACGLFIIAVGSYMAHMNLRQVAERGMLWSFGEIGLGVLVMLAAQVKAFLEVVPRGLRRKTPIIIISYDLWSAVWYRLPETAWPLWLLGWGIGLCAGGAVILALALGLV
jgi:hypothetical protein